MLEAIAPYIESVGIDTTYDLVEEIVHRYERRLGGYCLRVVTQEPDRNLALELVRVTEAAALASARWVGFGDKIAADQAAVDAMRYMLATVDMHGVVVIGEGEKDEAPMLFNGEQIGSGQGVEVDVAVDPLEGTELVARGPAQRAGRGGRRRGGQHVRPRPGASTWRSSPAAPTSTRSSTCARRSRRRWSRVARGQARRASAI